ncbi:hypothetical protein [Actinomadura sp. 3N508]|uniref:hypothetical protein n=1 Tax=Actinomadura sp. 3N508 TaxID=3375153 RepID=UPI0037A4DA66
MRSRISVRTLLPALLVVATVTAVAAPVSAHEAPPPAPETSAADSDTDKEDCELALKALAHHKLLPVQPEVAQALCSRNKTAEDQPEIAP